MDIDFQCVRCANCCKAVRLPLSVSEAIAWLQDGNPVQVLCEAIPWPGELPSSNALAAHKRARSFAARSRELPIRVLVTLAAPLGEGCPNLREDGSCGAYERRPSVCRIYPAERSPFLQFRTDLRHCPPEAWREGGTPFVRESRYVDGELREIIRTTGIEAVTDVAANEALCSALGITLTAMANEGYVAHAPEDERLLAALLAGGTAPAQTQDWTFVSKKAETIEALRAGGANCLSVDGAAAGIEYLSLFPD